MKQVKFRRGDIVALHKTDWFVTDVKNTPYGEIYVLESVDDGRVYTPFCYWFDVKGELVIAEAEGA